MSIEPYPGSGGGAVADGVLRRYGFRVMNLATDSRWFGITYEADADNARETLRNCVSAGVYNSPLWG